MKHSFDLDNFESFLSEQADRHRMYPGDRVWRNIQENLHGTSRWPALTFGAILTMATLAIVLTITYPNRNLLENNPVAVKSSSLSHVPMVNNAVPLVAKNSGNHAAPHSLGHIPLKEPVMLQSKANAANEIEPVQSNPVGSAEVAHLENAEEALNAERPDKSVISSGFEENTTTGTSDNKKPLPLASEVSTTHGLDIQPANTPEKFEYAASGNESLFEKSFIETSLGYGPVSFGKQLNSQRNNRWAIQVYATPSISYRYLLEDNKYVDDPSSINGPLAPYITNSVNQFVRHNAKMGMEIGASVLYRLSDNFRLKTGLQINYRQYGIEAYATNMQPAILTLNRGNGIDSVVRFTNISSQTGYRELNLSSNSLQVAIPIGFDLKMAQLNKFGFFISASGQLTYQLSNNSYVLSADYKNYMKQPELDRKFNINTAVEAFVSFDAGGVTWQAGPQIRYQMLPGTTSAYPIREHLIDYGLKVGVVKTLK